MGQVLGDDVGNALEIREVIDFLTGKRREARLRAVTTALASELLVLGGSPPTGRTPSRLSTGLWLPAPRPSASPACRDARWPQDLIEPPGRAPPTAPVTLPVAPQRPGIVACVDARLSGWLSSISEAGDGAPTTPSTRGRTERRSRTGP